MNLATYLFWALAAVLSLSAPLFSQTEYVSSSYYPAELEFSELVGLADEVRTESVPDLRGIMPPLPLKEMGFALYSRRVYRTSLGAPLRIEIFTFADSAGSFSLLTHLAPAPLSEGPPGNKTAVGGGLLVFQQGQFLVRISAGEMEDLAQRVARSISNRIGPRATDVPQLLNHLPDEGIRPASLRYIAGTVSLEVPTHRGIAARLDFPVTVEAVHVECELADTTGVLTVLSFPTMQIADEYFESGVPNESWQDLQGLRIYARRAGPLIGILAGGFSPASAERLLGSLKYAYTVQWIYDKNNRRGKTVWGVPVVILGTVVRSLLFVASLAGLSVLLGAGFAAFRLGLRRYAPNNPLDRPERTEMIRLKINED